MKNFLYIFFLTVSSFAFAQNLVLQSGPMVGYCEAKEAMIWLQTTKNANVKIEYYAVDEPKDIFMSDQYSTSKDVGFTFHVVLDKLEPGKKYNYTILIDNKRVVLPYETSFSSKGLWQWRNDPPNFSVAIGSCNYITESDLDRPGKPYGGGYEIFETINTQNPDIMVWGGDNIYLREADWDSKTGIYHRYSHTRKTKEMQKLLAKTQNYAIWDDHDYGPNDSDRSFYNKNITQKAFRDFWANKTYGKKPTQDEGIYSTFSWGDAQFFLLDNRYFKSPNDKLTGDKTLLGTEQLDWLIDNLVSSTAVFKIIIIGGQVLNAAEVFENYSNYDDEKSLLIKEITANKIKGVLFISGDRHFSELNQLLREKTYTLLDWTVSPLTASVVQADKIASGKSTSRVEGSLFSKKCFGLINFSGSKNNRQMKLSLLDADGKVLWKKVITKKELE